LVPAIHTDMVDFSKVFNGRLVVCENIQPWVVNPFKAALLVYSSSFEDG
jgi:hypothetical protein